MRSVQLIFKFFFGTLYDSIGVATGLSLIIVTLNFFLLAHVFIACYERVRAQSVMEKDEVLGRIM